MDRCGEDGGPKLDVTEWHRLKDELCRGVAMRLIATYDRSTVVSCKYLLTYFLCAAREDSVRPFARYTMKYMGHGDGISALGAGGKCRDFDLSAHCSRVTGSSQAVEPRLRPTKPVSNSVRDR